MRLRLKHLPRPLSDMQDVHGVFLNRKQNPISPATPTVEQLPNLLGKEGILWSKRTPPRQGL